MNWERWARAAGAGFVVLTVAAFIVGGDAPKVGDSTDDLISYYDGHRGKVLVSGLLFAFGLALLLWFAAAIANMLRESGEGRVAATVIAGATAFVTLQFVLTGMGASLAYSIAGGGRSRHRQGTVRPPVGAGHARRSSSGALRPLELNRLHAHSGTAFVAELGWEWPWRCSSCSALRPGRETASGRQRASTSSSSSPPRCFGYSWRASPWFVGHLQVLEAADRPLAAASSTTDA